MDILHEIRTFCAGAAFREEIVDLLERLCAIDTTPGDDLARLRENEGRVFEIIRAALEDLRLAGGSIVLKEVSPAIQLHPAFSRPYYASGSTEAVYRGRSNLLFEVDREVSPEGINTALNAHIDTVPPHIPPSRAGDLLFGRGAADDKGNVAAIIGALQVLAELERRGIVCLKNKLTAMFVIDEETGGNGSLELAMDRELKARYDSILVLECTGNRLHPANRGAVFIKCEGRLADAQEQSQVTPSLLEAFALAILALLDEGEAIRRESDHPLFPHRPVQTCTGILGPFGVHPSAICGEVTFTLIFPAAEGARSMRVPRSIKKQRSILSGGPQPVVEGCGAVFWLRPHPSTTHGADCGSCHTMNLVRRAPLRMLKVLFPRQSHPPMRCCVPSSTAASPATSPGTGTRRRSSTRTPAHARSSGTTTWPGTTPAAAPSRSTAPQATWDRCRRTTPAIAKWAHVMRELIDARRAAELAFTVTWPDAIPCGPSHLVFEGAQGFLPTHSLEEVKSRTRNAFLTAMQRVSGFGDAAAECHHLRCELRQAAQRCLRRRSELGNRVASAEDRRGCRI